MLRHEWYVDVAEHRNMPLESAVTMISRSYEQWLVNSGDPARSSQPSDPPSQLGRHAPAPDFKRPDDNVVRLLRMAIDGRCLVVEELDEIISHFQEQRDTMAKAQGIAPSAKSLPSGLCNKMLIIVNNR